jgi:hypothetical protein
MCLSGAGLGMSSMSKLATFLLENPKAFQNLTETVKQEITKAGINTVNIQAALARKNLVSRVNKNFILRNTFTIRQLQYIQRRQGPVKSLDEIKSVVGFTEKAGYMERQDIGGEHRPKQGSRLAIGTDKVRTGRDKKRPIARRFRLSNIENIKSRGPYTNKIKSKKARGVAMAYVASKQKLLVHYGKDLFTVKRFKKKGDNISFLIDKIYIRTKEKTYTLAQGYFLPECEKPAADIQKIFNSQMDKV